PAQVPAAVSVLLHRCLEKDPRQRISEVAVAKFVVSEHALLPDAAAPKPARMAGGPRASLAAMAVMLTGSALIVALAIPTVRHLLEIPAPEIRLEISTVATPAPLELALSPTDGTSCSWRRETDPNDCGCGHSIRARLDPSWVRTAPLTRSGPPIAVR